MRSPTGSRASTPVLTVGDVREFAASGGVLRFFLRDEQMRMEINLQAAEAAGLKISSRLLRIADLYEGGANRGRP